MWINPALRAAVRAQANSVCEYCRFPESGSEVRFVIDHIRARQHGGPTVISNLALCCPFCNFHKGPNLSGVDPENGDVVQLFNPRIHTWNEHFSWDKAIIVPLTAVGRVTVAVVDMNHPDQIELRFALIRGGE